MQNLECGFNPNCFEKAKAGWHFLFFGQIAQTFIKCTNVALAHNTCVNTLHLSDEKHKTTLVDNFRKITVQTTVLSINFESKNHEQH